ncbi:TetR/AcrR family transcriptional regulator [Sphingomonadaceae bacterium jetA1]|uniref:TetR/AcrR family transcriptional regulator n=1 Tax=Facivitalis istanbulensis TaxID=3075838 RepID=UPI00347B00AE
MKTPKAAKKRDAILAAAARVVAVKGYAETTLAEIGEAAGTFAGSLYYYFANKDALIEEVLNIGTTSVSRPVEEALDRLQPDAPAWHRIKSALDAHMQQMLVGNDYISAYWKIVDQVPEEMRERHRQHPRAYGNLWRNLMREGQAAGIVRPEVDPNLAQLFLLGATIYALDWYRPNGTLSPRDVSDRLADMFFRGVAPADAALGPLPTDKPAARKRKTATTAPAKQAPAGRKARTAP